MIPSLDNKKLHLMGIAGTAMASLAGLLTERGFHVTGSDQNVYPPMSDLLDSLGIDVHSPYAAANVPEGCDLVVVGNALSRGNVELESVLDRRIPCASMPEVLKEIFLRDRAPLVVTGTHGKTTTSSLAAWLLSSAGRDPGYLIGGIPNNSGVSFRVGAGEAFVVEGDEYDTAYFDKGPKFMHYLPQVAILGNVEFDHADIYRDVAEVERAFRRFVNLIPSNGALVVGIDSPLARTIAEHALSEVETFSVDGDADWTAEAVSSDSEATRIRLRRHGSDYLDFEGPFWGDAALRNVLAASAATARFGLTAEELEVGLSSFEGVRRRLEVRGEAGGVTVIDDFAHHPTAVFETLAGARRRYQDRKIWAVFEPRSFTARSRIFQDELGRALSLADAVVIAGVFSSARLAAEDELSEEEVVESLERSGTEARFIPRPDAIASFVGDHAKPGDVVLVMSNGGFGGVHEKILSALGVR